MTHRLSTHQIQTMNADKAMTATHDMRRLYHGMDVRLEKHFEPEPNSGCWIWFGCSNARGYGKIGIGNGKTLLAHRASWIVNRGEIPEGTLVLHRCDNPSCVNPDHLFLGTHLDNARDRQEKGRGRQPRGESHGRAKLNRIQVNEVLLRCAAGERQIDIAESLGVSKSLVQAINSGRIWSHSSSRKAG